MGSVAWLAKVIAGLLGQNIKLFLTQETSENEPELVRGLEKGEVFHFFLFFQILKYIHSQTKYKSHTSLREESRCEASINERGK